MEMENLLPAKSRNELRDWLQINGKTETSCWVIVSMTPKPEILFYLDAVEESLCVGWIDGVKRNTLKRNYCSDYPLGAKEVHGLN